jgi:hypothetical protein
MPDPLRVRSGAPGLGLLLANLIALVVALPLAVHAAAPADDQNGGAGARVRVTPIGPAEGASIASGEATPAAAPEAGPAEPGRRPVPFGSAVAWLPVGDHEPGIPYSIEVISEAGEVRIAREEREILDVRALERHLVVASRCTGPGSETLGEVIDESGAVAWTFTAPGDFPPRVTVLGGRAAAVYPGRQRSIVELRTGSRPASRRWVVEDAVLTQAALSTGGDGLLVWGPRQAVWIEAGNDEIAWRVDTPGAARPLASASSGFTPVAGAVGLPVRERRADGGWSVDLLLLDVIDGGTLDREPLLSATALPTVARRSRSGDAERIVVAGQLFEISPARGATP